MLSLLCSQNLFSASSPPILENKQSKSAVCAGTEVRQSSCQSAHGDTWSGHRTARSALPTSSHQILRQDNIPCIIPGLKDGEQSNVIRKPGPSKIPVDVTQPFAFADERFREAGGRRDGTNSISHTDRNHKRHQDWVYAQYCCQQLLQAADRSENLHLEVRNLSNLAVYTRLGRNTAQEVDAKSAPIPVAHLSQQPASTSPFSTFPPPPTHSSPHHLLLVART